MQYLVITKRDANENDYIDEWRHKDCGKGISQLYTSKRPVPTIMYVCRGCRKEFIFGGTPSDKNHNKDFYIQTEKLVDGSKLDKVERMVWKSNGKTMYLTLEPMTEADIVKWHFEGCQVTPISEAVVMGQNTLKVRFTP